jgi:uracil-DNA glycosylase family 4
MTRSTALPHPVTGVPSASPAPPGTGWPDDPADPATPVATDADDVRTLSASATLPDLDARVSVCRACPRLVAWREEVAVAKRAAYADQPYWGRPVPGFGSAKPALLIVGLAPGAHGANRTGRNFTGGRSGDFLYAALHRAGFASQPTSTHAGDGLTLIGARVTPAVHCVPPKNKPTTAEEATCAPWLDRELSLLASSLTGVLCLGGLAWEAFAKAARRTGWTLPAHVPTFAHGAAYEARAGDRVVRVVASYHVSQQNTFTGRLTPAMLDEIVAPLRPCEDGALEPD